MKKNVLVTGSARGIGFSIAKELGIAGYNVIMCATKPNLPETAEAKLKNAKCDYEYVMCDITNPEQVDALYNKLAGLDGGLYGLVNNAGVAPLVRSDILEVGKESFDRVLNINLKGTFFMCQRFANFMLQQKEKWGSVPPRIVNISSCSSYTSSVMRGEYCISKAGISMITKLFADRLAEFGVPVFEVSPGIIRSDMTESVLKSYQARIENGLTPIQRLGEPEDVAKCVRALFGGDFDFCTGQVIHADGGFHLRRL